MLPVLRPTLRQALRPPGRGATGLRLVRPEGAPGPAGGSPGRGYGGARGHPGDPEVQVRTLAGEHGGIAEILMNRPHARNSLGKVFISEWFAALDRLRGDSGVRVVVVRSAVKGVFCAGADLKEREQMSDAEVGPFVQRLRTLMDEIAAFPAPTIAAMDGFALGGGLELALACDLRVAASSAIMGLIETTRGLLPGAGNLPPTRPPPSHLRPPTHRPTLGLSSAPHPACSPGHGLLLRALPGPHPPTHLVLAGRSIPSPALVNWYQSGTEAPGLSSAPQYPHSRLRPFPCAGGTQRLPRCVGTGLAKELIFTGRRVDGQEAAGMGLVNHAVQQNQDGDAAYHRALALALEIVPQAPIAVKLGKVAVSRGMEVRRVPSPWGEGKPGDPGVGA
uniref:Enoyl-CoA hydratase domain containing 2 n=1 Tax=Ornithorhynchus anatinus TaxID=9258 RepID=A0A6I8NJW5_ORNAN